jgi:regulator of sigma D
MVMIELQISKQDIDVALSKIQVGLDKYMSIMKRLHNVDISKDEEFQRMYNGFYRVRQRKLEFYNCYYKLMEDKKDENIEFEEVLRTIYKSVGRIEPSFSSKLVATLNPNMPVWDKYVLANLGLKQPSYSETTDKAKQKRITKLIDLYEQIIEWYSEVVLSEIGKDMIVKFDQVYSSYEITDVKKIDLILWQIR